MFFFKNCNYQTKKPAKASRILDGRGTKTKQNKTNIGLLAMITNLEDKKF